MKEILFYLFLILIGVNCVAMSLVFHFVSDSNSLLEKYLGENNNMNKIDKILNKIGFVNTFENYCSTKFYILNYKITARTITKITISSIFIGLLFALVIKNIIVIPFIIMVGIISPQLYFSILKTKEKNKIEEQLGHAIRFFRTEYTTTNNVPIALQNIIPKLQDPLKSHFEKLSQEINYGINPKTALIEFKNNVQNKFATIFANLLITHFEKGTDFGDKIISISTRINSTQLRYKENRSELATMRITNYILNGALFASIIIIYFFAPEWGLVYKNTVEGQMLMTLFILNGFSSIILGFKISDK